MTFTVDTLLDFDGANQSIAEHALDYGIPASRIIMRLDAGWSIEKAITRPIQVSAQERKAAPAPIETRKRTNTKRALSRRRIAFDGRSLTIIEWAKELGITRRALDLRLESGWPLERALTVKDGRNDNTRSIMLEHKGQRHSMADWARIVGLPVSTLNARIDKGWPVDEALTTPSLTRRGVRA